MASSKSNRFSNIFLILMISVITISACNKKIEQTTSNREIDTPTPIPTAFETATPVVSTATLTPQVVSPSPTATFPPTNTPIIPTNTPIPTATQIPTNTPLPTSTLEPTSNITISSLADWWPMQAGNYWVYLSININLGESATYVMTDTIKKIDQTGDYYVVTFLRKAQFVYGEEQLGEFSNSIKPGEHFYIVSEQPDGIDVYHQEELNLTQLDSSWLLYKFPLETNACWTSESHTGNILRECNITVVGEDRFHPLSIGRLEECYHLRTITFVGSGESLFCPGIGTAKNSFRLNTNDPDQIPASYDEILIDYFVQE